VILIDANLLLHAYNPRSAVHEAARSWLQRALSGPEPVAFAWVTVWAFLRISTSSRVFEQPLTIAEATDIVASWLAQPAVGLLEPGDRHWDILRKTATAGQAAGSLVMDAALAAIAREHGARLCTTDRDFARFPDVSWVNPLART